MASEFSHPSLGHIQGNAKEGVVQFLGVKYASIKDRFAASEVFDHSESNFIDATKPGPYVISPPVWDMEFGFIQKSLPMPEMRMSELEGLNLNISVPLIQGKIPSPEQMLPVFMFVHGGGYALGSNAWPQYDQARIVRLSTKMGKPVIGVGINYRVGLPGFLTSQEMRKEGYVANNGLRDQANALRWIKKFIGGFGGDSGNVTFIGESAGSVSGSLLLHSTEPLFKRYVSMSGTSLMMKPLPPPVSEFAYSSVIEMFGLKDASGPERIKALLALPVEKLLSVPPNIPLVPVIDGDLIRSIINFAQISSKDDDPALDMPGRKWCQDLLIGDCQFDGSIGSFMLGPKTVSIAKGFCSSIGKTLADYPAAAEKLRHAYQITPDLADDVALRNVLQFSTDIGFYATALAFAQGWPGKARVYHFNEPNPWEGPWKGEAGHVLDIAFLFQNYNEHLEPEQKAVAVKFAEDVIKFANGACDWKAFNEGEGARIYGPSRDGICGEYVEGIAQDGSGRKNIIFELAEEIGLEPLSAAWGNFLTGN
ncbi:carboxylesterase-like protein [Rhexocercosporidium sp. MPI-PUGE-AT-0058]|nr:carboxylesterase-like protein [Rhexocercosporidium sp. MPI-PUGE-AT-0058]